MPSFKESDKAARVLYDACTDLMEEEPFFAKLRDTLRSGKIKVSSMRKDVRKTIESEWMDAIELSIVSLDNVIRSPGRYLVEIEEIKPIELSHNITNKSIRDLAQHVEYISGVEDGNVVPTKILNCYNEETLLTYENKFVNTLIHRLYYFIDRRYSEILKKGSESGTDFDISADFSDGDLSAEINFGIHIKSAYSSGDEATGQQIERLRRLYQVVQAYMGSSFIKAMGNAFVRPPIMRTNALLKNRDLRACLELWDYIQSYEKVGYSISVHQSSEQPDEAVMDRLYANLALQYAVYRREIARAKETLEEEDVTISQPIFRRELKAVEQKKYIFPTSEYVRVTPVKYLAPPLAKGKGEKKIREIIDRALKVDAMMRELEIKEAERKRKEEERLRREAELYPSLRDIITDAEQEPVEVPIFSPVPGDIVINVTDSGRTDIKVSSTELISDISDYEVRSLDEEGMAMIARLNKSFMARLIQAEDEVKEYYSAIKNKALSYAGVKSRISWNYDSFNAGRKQLLKLGFRGKTLCLYLALDPDSIAETKYKVEKADAKKYEDVPCLYRIRSALRVKYARELIEMLMEKHGIEFGEDSFEDFRVPYEETAALIEKGLIKETISKENYNDFLARHGWEQKSEEEPKKEEATPESELGSLDQYGDLLSSAKEEDKLRRSFMARLIQSDADVKEQYSTLKNQILSYEGTVSKITWNFDSVSAGGEQLLKFNVKGKSLYVYLALDASKLESKYKVRTVSDKVYSDVPCLMKITSERKYKHSAELIDLLAKKHNLVRSEDFTPEDYVLPYEENEPLIERGLIKIPKSVEDAIARSAVVTEPQPVTISDGEEEIQVKEVNGDKAIVIRYKKSFTAKLIQAPDETKKYYSALKNKILSFNRAVSRVSWSCDSIHSGRNQLIKFGIKGKSLYVYMALSPEELDSKYRAKKASGKKYAEVPCLMKITSDRKFRYTEELIDKLAEKFGLVMGEAQNVDYVLPYEENAPLIERGLIKEMQSEVELKDIADKLALSAASTEAPEAEESAEVEESADVEEGLEEPTDIEIEQSGGINVQYRKSFTARLIQSPDEIKGYYSEIRNKLLSFKGVSARVSWANDSVNKGRTKLAKLNIKGRTLYVYLALDADEFASTKYKTKAASGKKFSAVSCLIKVKSSRKLKYTLELIDIMASKLGLTAIEREKEDFAPPFESTETLIEKGLIKEQKDGAAFIPARSDRASEEGLETAAAESAEEVGAIEDASVKEASEKEAPAEAPEAEVEASEEKAEDKPEEKKGFFARLFSVFRGRRK